MTTVAGGIRAVLREFLANRFWHGAGFIRQIRIHTGRRRRNRKTQNIVEQKFPAQDRRCSIGVRCGRQQRALRKQPAALIVVRQRHAPEAAAINSGYAVMPCEPLVNERVVRIQKVRYAPVLTDRAADKQFGFALKSLKQTFVDRKSTRLNSSHRTISYAV